MRSENDYYLNSLFETMKIMLDAPAANHLNSSRVLKPVHENIPLTQEQPSIF